MATTSAASSNPHFEFNLYRFCGRGQHPTLVSSVSEAHFLRSRQSVEKNLIDTAKARVEQWCRKTGVSVWMKPPFPSNQAGRVWLEFHVGGLKL